MKIILLLILSIVISEQCLSATFCVSNATEFQSALTIATNNSDSDVIKLKPGIYNAPSSGFSFWSNENFDLEISGGWSEFFGNPCGLQTIGPYNTTLDGGGGDGDNNNGVLSIATTSNVTTADITIENILFFHGYIDENAAIGDGGGLAISTDISHYIGHVKIILNVFIGNRSQYSSAVYASGGKLTFKNNLIIENRAEYTGSVALFSHNKTGIYITNNTIVGNKINSTNNLDLGGLRFRVTGTSKALLANNIFYDNDMHDLMLEGDGYKYLFNNNIVKPAVGVSADEESLNFSSVPIFYDLNNQNYTPAYNSDLINNGYIPVFFPPNPFYRNWALTSTDLAGNNRVVESLVDVGAYETPIELPIFKNGFE